MFDVALTELLDMSLISGMKTVIMCKNGHFEYIS